MLLSIYSGRRIILGLLIFSIVVLTTRIGSSIVTGLNDHIIRPSTDAVKGILPSGKKKDETAHPKYKPTPTYTPPAVQDPFPLLATSTPPPIPKWNVPRKGLHKEYGLTLAPPLLIGFTRTWPILLQAVVSYITAGWPPSQIYVVENTGVQQANARGQLTLQNPFYMDHNILKNKLGVNIIQTPTLLSFAQLQNFFLSLTYQHNWPYYFWSHQDVLALSFEDGFENVTTKFYEKGYKTLYELCVQTPNQTPENDPHWGIRFFAYDHLALVNPRAYEDVGGWDTLIPYYMTDCDMHTRLTMANWTQIDAKAGIITDVNTALKDLKALYRNKALTPEFLDPNPPPPPPPEKQPRRAARRGVADDAELEYWRLLQRVADTMFHYKHGERGRNTWQKGQRGGFDEQFYYPPDGVAEGIEVLTEAGREVFRRKWGHRDCDLITGAGLKLWDQWRVEKDWDN